MRKEGMGTDVMGAKVWLPCTVSPGQFANERAVSIDLGDRNWSEFVNVSLLKTKVEEGEDQVLANILCSTENTFQARIPGEAIRGAVLEGSTSKYWESMVQ